MNVIQAMRETLDLAREAELDLVSSDIPELDYPHLSEMVEMAAANPFSEGKLNRWLGWIQAAVMAQSNGSITLEHLKEVNRRNK